MIVTVRVRARVQRDLEQAARWYEKQRQGLGGEFLDEVQAVFEAIAAHPEAYPVLHRRARRAVLRRFPFGVYYRVSSDVAVVVAIMHGSRDPRKWMERT